MCFLHPLIIQRNKIYSKKCAKNKYLYLNEVIWLMSMKLRLKMKNRSSRWDINRHRRRYEHKYTKYKMCLMIKHHLSKIWSSILGKVKQHWGWVKKELLIKKAYTSILAKVSVFISMFFFRHKYVSRRFAITFQIISHKKVLLYYFMFYCFIATWNCKNFPWLLLPNKQKKKLR